MTEPDEWYDRVCPEGCCIGHRLDPDERAELNAEFNPTTWTEPGNGNYIRPMYSIHDEDDHEEAMLSPDAARWCPCGLDCGDLRFYENGNHWQYDQTSEWLLEMNTREFGEAPEEGTHNAFAVEVAEHAARGRERSQERPGVELTVTLTDETRAFATERILALPAGTHIWWGPVA